MYYITFAIVSLKLLHTRKFYLDMELKLIQFKCMVGSEVFNTAFMSTEQGERFYNGVVFPKCALCS